MTIRTPFLASASLAALLIASAAVAQTPAAERNDAVAGDSNQAQTAADPATAGQEDGVADIIVTAERREASLQSVPIAVTALNAARLQNNAIQTGSDLERLVPSLKMSPNVTQPGNLSPSLRGSVTQDAALTVAESAFGIYIDDVFVGRLNANNTTLQDIERVEVLRGPQGTLYGRNTLAGAIKYITRVPGEKTWVEAQVGAGNYNQYLVSGSVGGPIGSGFAGSASFQANGRNGFGRNLATGKNIGEEDSIAGRAKLRYTGIENLDITGTFSYSRLKNDAAVLVPFTTTVAGNRVARMSQIIPTVGYYNVNRTSAAEAAARPFPIQPQPFGRTTQYIGSLAIAYDFGDVTLKSITAYVETRDYFNADFTGVGGIRAGSPSRSRQYTQELQLLGTALDGRLNYLIGGYYLFEKARQDFGWYFFVPPFLPIGPVSQTFSRNSTDSISGFAQADFEIIEGLKATAGIRYTKDTKDFSIRLVPFGTGPAAPVSFKNLSYDAWTPKIGLDYTVPVGSGFIDRLLIYGNVSRGFRSGGFNGINIFNLDDARTPYFPEKNWTYEGGFKANLFDRKLQVNANYFVNRISGLLLNATVAGGTAFPVQNSGSATIKGLEYEINFVPLRGLNIFVGGAELSGKFRSLAPGSAAAQARVLSNVEPGTPQTGDSLTGGFDFTGRFPLGDKEGAVKFGADIYKSGSYILAATNDLVVDGYDRINAFIALEYNRNIELRFTVRNLENDRSFITGSRGLGGFIALPPRTYLATLGYKM